MSFDLNFFHLSYQNRIGFIQKDFKDGSLKSERGNVGDANLSGLESLIDLNIGKLFKMNLKKYSLNSFINYSFIFFLLLLLFYCCTKYYYRPITIDLDD